MTIKKSNETRTFYFEELHGLFEKYFTWTQIFDNTVDELFFELMSVADDKDKKQAIHIYTMYHVEIGRKLGYSDAMTDIKMFANNKKEACIKCQQTFI